MTTQEIKKSILERFDSGTAQSSDIMRHVLSQDKNVPPSTITWALYNMVKKNEAVRLGRGVYSFKLKPYWRPVLSAKAVEVASAIREQMPYLNATIADTSVLSEFMVQQPFSYAIIVEVPMRLVDSVVQKLNSAGMEVFSWANRKLAELYVQSETTVYITKALKTTAVIPYEGNIKTSTLEKILVDILAEPELYGQSQGIELENIFANTSGKYVLDYSQMLKYATNRGKRKDAEALLMNNMSYQDYLEAIK